MKENRIISFVALFVLLLVVFLPVQAAEAFRGTIERERVPVQPSGADDYQNPPDANVPSTPEPSTPPAPSYPGSGTEKDNPSYIIPKHRSGRSGGTFVPVVPSPSPSQPPADPPEPPPGSANPQPPALPEAPSWLTPDEAKAFILLNETRIKNNVSPVDIDPKLVDVARLKARDMVENDYFGHVSPTYGSVSQMLSRAGITYSRAAENLSKAGDVYRAHLQLEYSTQGHRQIMLSPNYNYVGIGVLPLKNVPGIVMVQLFTD